MNNSFTGEIFCSGKRRRFELFHGLDFSRDDINPPSIMFKSDGTSVIIDFDSRQVVGEKLMKGGDREDKIYKCGRFWE